MTKTQVITKLKLWKTQIVTTQIVLKIQIVTKLSRGQNLKNDHSNFNQIQRNLKLQNILPTKDRNVDTRLLGPDNGPAIQLHGGPDPEEDGPGLTHYQMRVSAGEPDKARHMTVLKKYFIKIYKKWRKKMQPNQCSVI